MVDAIGQIGATGVTHCRRRREYGGKRTGQLERLEELEKENRRLGRAVSAPTLGEPILAEAARGTEGPRQRSS